MNSDLVEWFAVPNPGAVGYISGWLFKTDSDEIQSERLTFRIGFRGEVLRVWTPANVRQLAAVCCIDGRGYNFVMKRTTECVRP